MRRWLALVCSALAACTEQSVPSGLIVEVRSDLRAPDEVDALWFQVSSGQEPFERVQALGEPSSGVNFPVRLGLLWEPGETRAPTRLTLKVSAHKGESTVVTALALADLIPTKVETVRIELRRACAGVVCRDGFSCHPDSQACLEPGLGSAVDAGAPADARQPPELVPGPHWLNRTPSAPPADSVWPRRFTAVAAAYVPARDATFILGRGATGAPELWAWQGSTGTFVRRHALDPSSLAVCPPRFSWGLYPSRNDGPGVITPGWPNHCEWNDELGTWTDMQSRGVTPPLTAQAQAYDVRTGHRLAVLRGDRELGFQVDATWEQDPDALTWSNLQIEPPRAVFGAGPPRAPFERIAAAIWDAGRNVSVIFGSSALYPLATETWEWHGLQREWVNRPGAVLDFRLSESLSVAAYNNDRQSIMIVDSAGDLWEWPTARGIWTRLHTAPATGRPSMGPAAYDTRRKRLVVIGEDQLWEWYEQ